MTGQGRDRSRHCAPAYADDVTLIVLSGLPGVGKTTIARKVAASLRAVYLRIDTIEHALRNAGSKVEAEGYCVAYAVAEDNLKVGRIVVADCVNPWPLTRNEWRLVADRAGVALVDVEIVCGDLAEHRRRVESRAPDLAGQRLPTWADVVGRDYRPWSCERLVIDTACRDVEASVRAILAVARPPGDNA